MKSLRAVVRNIYGPGFLAYRSAGLTLESHGASTATPMKIITKLLCALALTPIMALAAEYPDISHDDLKKAIEEKKVVLLDVNGSDSWKQGHIPGAIDFTATKDLATKLPATMKTAPPTRAEPKPRKSSATLT